MHRALLAQKLASESLIMVNGEIFIVSGKIVDDGAPRMQQILYN